MCDRFLAAFVFIFFFHFGRKRQRTVHHNYIHLALKREKKKLIDLLEYGKMGENNLRRFFEYVSLLLFSYYLHLFHIISISIQSNMNEFIFQGQPPSLLEILSSSHSSESACEKYLSFAVGP